MLTTVRRKRRRSNGLAPGTSLRTPGFYIFGNCANGEKGGKPAGTLFAHKKGKGFNLLVSGKCCATPTAPVTEGKGRKRLFLIRVGAAYSIAGKRWLVKGLPSLFSDLPSVPTCLCGVTFELLAYALLRPLAL